jgi:glycosyltransferase involved in cell wall biosynthesis
MHQRGHEVAILFLQHAVDIGGSNDVEHGFLAELDERGISYSFIGQASRGIPFRGFSVVRSHIRSFRPDVVHTHLYSATLLCAFARVPVVYTRHGIDLRVPKLFYSLVMDRIVDSYVGICQACTLVLENTTRKQVVRIDNGARPEKFRVVHREARDPKRRLVFLSVGRLNRYKNYPLLLEALALLPRDGSWCLRMAGDGEEMSSLRDLAKRLGIADLVEFLGSVDNIPLELASADIFVMSSRSEGLPIALIEATLAGLPVVVTNVGGCAEVVHEARNGIVVDGQDAQTLAVALRRMLEDAGFREDSARNAMEHGGRYTLDAAVTRHIELYRSSQSSFEDRGR